MPYPTSLLVMVSQSCTTEQNKSSTEAMIQMIESLSGQPVSTPTPRFTNLFQPSTQQERVRNGSTSLKLKDMPKTVSTLTPEVTPWLCSRTMRMKRLRTPSLTQISKEDCLLISWMRVIRCKLETMEATRLPSKEFLRSILIRRLRNK